MKRVGFIIDSHVPSLANLLKRKCGIRGLLNGMLPSSSVALMRYTWIADEVNRTQAGVSYEVYRPWRRSYDALVFLKSMGPECLRLLKNAKRNKCKTVFDANVDYFSVPSGTFYYEGMAPDSSQREDAIAMAEHADLVIADSTHIQTCAAPHCQKVEVVTDNIRKALYASSVPESRSMMDEEGRLNLFWSGEAVKLFDLLEAEEALIDLKDKIHLNLITSDLSALSRWRPEIRSRFEKLLDSIHHSVIPFTSIEDLLELYRTGGVFISPRFLDNSYNLGHTEWKITLPLSSGIPVVCSPQPSYIEAAGRIGESYVTVCHDTSSWIQAISRYLEDKVLSSAAMKGMIKQVDEHYSTTQVAQTHLHHLQTLFEVAAK